MFNSKVTSQSLQKRSSDILSTFNKTITELKDVNAKAEAQAASNREEAKKLVDEAVSLDSVTRNNSRVIEKIESFLA